MSEPKTALLNSYNTLVDVELDGTDKIRLRFTDKNKPTLDHFSVVQLKKKNKSLKMAQRFTPLIGENLILQANGDTITYWKGEIGKPKGWKDKETFKPEKYKSKKVDKTAEEWLEQFTELHKKYDALKAKKGFKLHQYRSAMRKEIEAVVYERINLAKNHGTAVEQNTINIIQFALNDLGDPDKNDEYVEFIAKVEKEEMGR